MDLNNKVDCLTPKQGKEYKLPSNYIPPHFTGKRQGSICHDEQVAYRPLIIW